MKVKFRNWTLLWHALTEPKPNQSGVLKFNSQLRQDADSEIIIPKDGDEKGTIKLPATDFEKVCLQVCKEKWPKLPPKMTNWAYNQQDGTPILNFGKGRDEASNAKGEIWPGLDADSRYVSPSVTANKVKGVVMDGTKWLKGHPVLLDQGREPVVPQDGKLFYGAKVNLVADLYGFDMQENGKTMSSLNLTLLGVQLMSGGEKLLGEVSVDEDDFEEEEFESEEADTELGL